MKHGTWFGVPDQTNTTIDHWVLPLPGVRSDASIKVRCGVVRLRDRTYQPAWFGTCTHYEVVNVPLKAQSVTAAQVEFLTWLENRHHERWQLLREMRERLHGKEAP